MDTKPKEKFRVAIADACAELNKKTDYPLSTEDLAKAIGRTVIELERCVTGETFWGKKLG